MIDKKKPLVTVVVPSYNHDKYVDKCIKSIIDQTYSNIELIVIDDGSSDESVSIIKDLKKKHEFKFIEQENMGLTKTLNKALSFSNGKYISIVASDDFWKPQKIEYQVDYMEKNADTKLCFSDVVYVDEYSKPTGRPGYQERNIKLIQSFDDVLMKAKLPPASLFLKLSELKAVGGFDEKLKVEDLDLWLKVLKSGGNAAILPQKLVFYRDYEGNTHKRKVKDLIDNHLLTIQKYLKYSSVKDKVILNEWYLRSAYTLIDFDKHLAVEYLKKGCRRFWDIRIYKFFIKYLIN